MNAFDVLDLNNCELKPINDDVIVSDMEFDSRTLNSGIIIPNDNGTGHGIRPRWGKVYAVGPEQHDVMPLQWVCVAHGRWTRGIDIKDNEGHKVIRKIDPNDILLVSDDIMIDETFSDAIHIDKK